MEEIAMKMTQKEFDIIKEFFPGSCVYFEDGKYLINTSMGGICFTYFGSRALRDRVIYNSFDRDVFLKACGIEDFKTWKTGDMQYKDEEGNWIDLSLTAGGVYRFKPHPSYSKEIEDLQKRANENGMKAIITFEKL